MSDKHEYWLICYFRKFPPFELKVTKAYFDVATQDANATIITSKDGKERSFVIQSKKQFTHLNKTFLVTEVEKPQ